MHTLTLTDDHLDLLVTAATDWHLLASPTTAAFAGSPMKNASSSFAPTLAMNCRRASAPAKVGCRIRPASAASERSVLAVASFNPSVKMSEEAAKSGFRDKGSR